MGSPRSANSSRRGESETQVARYLHPVESRVLREEAQLREDAERLAVHVGGNGQSSDAMDQFHALGEIERSGQSQAGSLGACGMAVGRQHRLFAEEGVVIGVRGREMGADLGCHLFGCRQVGEQAQHMHFLDAGYLHAGKYRQPASGHLGRLLGSADVARGVVVADGDHVKPFRQRRGDDRRRRHLVRPARRKRRVDVQVGTDRSEARSHSCRLGAQTWFPSAGGFMRHFL